MQQITDAAELRCLAHLELGDKVREAADKTTVSYTKALKLKQLLEDAKEKDAVSKLFNMDEIAKQLLLDAVKKDAAGPLMVLGEGTTELEASVDDVIEAIDTLGQLETAAQETATVLVNKIGVMAASSNDHGTIESLAASLAAIQKAFFAPGVNVNVDNVNNFESFLKD